MKAALIAKYPVPRLLRLVVAPLLLGLVTSGCASGVSGSTSASDPDGQDSASASQYPTNCPAGFVDALESSLLNADSAWRVRPRKLDLGELEPRIACAVRTRSPGESWLDRDYDFTVVVMQADVSERDVRYALEGLGFDQSRFGWGRDGAAPGEVGDLYLQTYGELARNLSGNSPEWSRFRDTFPPETVVLGATVPRKKADHAPADPVEPLPTAPEPSPIWRCSYSPTYNRDWHDDVVCSNGVEEHRPYLREWDNFITQDEIMESAREYERLLNGG